MARSNRGRRDDLTPDDIAIQRMVAPARPVTVTLSTLNEQDLRLWSPTEDLLNEIGRTRLEALPNVNRGRLRTVGRFPTFNRGPIYFGDRPDNRALVCKRRQTRREVFFAKRLYRKRGRGAGRRTWRSNFGC